MHRIPLTHTSFSSPETTLRLAREQLRERRANTQTALKQYLNCVEAENAAYLEVLNAEKTRDELSEYELIMAFGAEYFALPPEQPLSGHTTSMSVRNRAAGGVPRSRSASGSAAASASNSAGSSEWGWV